MDDSARRKHPRRVVGSNAKRQFAVISGFDPAAMVMTAEGPVPFEWLAEGDLLATRDGGYQPVIWMDRTRLTVNELQDFPEFTPIRVARDVLNTDLPHRTMYVSPSQLVHVGRNPQNPSSDGVLIPAEFVFEKDDLADRPGSDVITHVSVMLPEHHLIQVEGSWMGSLFTADLGRELPDDCPVKHKLAHEEMEPLSPILGAHDAQKYLAARDQAGGLKRA